MLVDDRRDMTPQYALTTPNAKRVLGCVRKSVASRLREGILYLCSGETPPVVQHPALGYPR